MIDRILTRNSYVLIGKVIVSLVSLVILTPWIIDRIGISDIGLLSAHYAFIILFSFIDAGIAKTFVYEYSKFKESSIVLKQYKKIYFLAASVMSSITLILWFFDYNIFGLEEGIINDNAMISLSISVFIYIYSGFYRVIIEYNYDIAILNTLLVVQSLMLSIGWLIMSYLNVDPSFIYYISPFVIFSFGLSCYLIVKMRYDIKNIRNTGVISYSSSRYRILVKHSSVSFVNSLSGNIVRIALLVIPTGSLYLGIYEIANRLIQYKINIASFMINPFYVVLLRAYNDNKEIETSKYHKYIFIATVSMFAISLVMSKTVLGYYSVDINYESFFIYMIVLANGVYHINSELYLKILLAKNMLNEVILVRILYFIFYFAISFSIIEFVTRSVVYIVFVPLYITSMFVYLSYGIKSEFIKVHPRAIKPYSPSNK